MNQELKHVYTVGSLTAVAVMLGSVVLAGLGTLLGL